MVLLGLLIGSRLFIPWNEISELGFLRVSSSLYGSTETTISARDFSNEGIFPTFSFKGVDIDGLGIQVHLESLKVAVKPLSSVLTGRVVVDVYLNKGSLSLPGDQPRSFGGNFNCSYGEEEIEISDVDIKGDISASGKSTMSVSNKRITEADMAFSVPETMEGVFPMAKKYLPLSKGEDGTWLLRRKKES
ncbi:hypothetical protein L2W58_02965 [Dethiosulfovibrio sp. F2B]|nr:type II secretion system protein GspN [Dethiosulfovibrio faecalis]MCF4150752.1 hypothetical protein [Dethiosulfovibrio faecalis]